MHQRPSSLLSTWSRHDKLSGLAMSPHQRGNDHPFASRQSKLASASSGRSYRKSAKFDAIRPPKVNETA
jgi:hypothetical protein